MIITRLEEVGKKQVRVFFDEERYCLLFLNEVRRLDFQEKQEVGQEEFQELNELLLLRAKRKAMWLLECQDRTRAELFSRLERLEFPSFLIEQAVSYVESYGYINDEEYVRRYMEYRANKKSRLQIRQELQKKGISSDILERIWEQYDYQEEEVVEEQLKKRIRQKGPVTTENFQKYYGFLARKGFSSNLILDLLKKYKQL